MDRRQFIKVAAGMVAVPFIPDVSSVPSVAAAVEEPIAKPVVTSYFAYATYGYAMLDNRSIILEGDFE